MSEPNEPTPAAPAPGPAPVPPGAASGWGPEYSQPLGYGQPQYGQPQYGQPQAQYGQPQYGQPQYGQPQPQYGQPQPQYGQPQYGQPQTQYGQPQYGQPQYGQPQYGQPQYGQPQYGQPQYGAPTGYVPAPVQRGIVPLRPLSLGEIYDGAFRSVRANPRVMFGFSAMIVAGSCIIGGLLWYLIVPTLTSWLGSTVPDDSTYDPYGSIAATASMLGVYSLMPFLLLAAAILGGVLTVSVSRSVIGQKITVAELWSRYWRRVGMVVLASIVLGLATVAAWFLFVLLIALIGSAAGGLAVLLGLVGGAAMVAATIWFLVRVLFVPPVLMLEDLRFWPSITRAWRLTRGSFWRIFGIWLLAQVITYVASQVLSVPLSLLSLFFISDMGSPGFIAMMTITMAVSYALPAVFIAAVVALQYIDVRIRKEGLDVQLARAAEAAAQQEGAL